MIRRPPISTRTDTLFPYTTLFRSLCTGERTALPRERCFLFAQPLDRCHAVLDLTEGRQGGPAIGEGCLIPTCGGTIGLRLDKAAVEDGRKDAATQRIDGQRIVRRSEARRVGKECVRTGRSGWSPYP